MRYARPNNAEELKATIRAAWALITPEQCHRLIDSMPRRIAAVIQAKGAPTKYWVLYMFILFMSILFSWPRFLKIPFFVLVLSIILIFWDTEFWVFIVVTYNHQNYKKLNTWNISVSVEWMYTYTSLHFLNGICEINQLFEDILIIWPAPVLFSICCFLTRKYKNEMHYLVTNKHLLSKEILFAIICSSNSVLIKRLIIVNDAIFFPFQFHY